MGSVYRAVASPRSWPRWRTQGPVEGSRLAGSDGPLARPPGTSCLQSHREFSPLSLRPLLRQPPRLLPLHLLPTAEGRTVPHSRRRGPWPNGKKIRPSLEWSILPLPMRVILYLEVMFSRQEAVLLPLTWQPLAIQMPPEASCQP